MKISPVTDGNLYEANVCSVYLLQLRIEKMSTIYDIKNKNPPVLTSPTARNFRLKNRN